MPQTLWRRCFRCLALLLSLVIWALTASRPLCAQVAPPTAEGATPGAASAAPAASDEQRRTEAKERFLRGLELANQENWDAALVEFMTSRELFPTRAALSNIPLSLRHLKRYAEASEAYRELIEKFGTSMTPEERKKVDDALAELRNLTGEIDVESDPAGATIVIDGQQRGATPLPAPLLVNAGTHSVRVMKEGFESYEAQVPVAGKQRKTVQAKLRRLARGGTLVVREANQKELEVLVDGAPVGKTPWQGQLAVGVHGVSLRGEGDLGTPPSAATVVENQTTTVTLAAKKLDARVRVEPVPSNARVDIDGVSVGAGIWEGQLESGAHRIEVYATGHIPYSKQITVSSGRREIVRVALERDLSNPMWAVGYRPHLFVELVGGAAFSSGFGMSADSACDRQVTLPTGSVAGCSDQAAPSGFLVGGRGGYQFTSGLGLEVFLGYLNMSESMTRAIVAEGETRGNQRLSFASPAAEDSTGISAPLGALSASYQFFDKTPLLFRLWGGVMRARVKHSLKGTFSGDVPYTVSGANMTQNVSQPVDVVEPATNVWVPLVGPEVRFGYRISKRFAVDLGVAGFIFLGPGEPRSGGNIGSSNRRPTILNEVQSPEGVTVKPGVMRLDAESSVSTCFGIVPTLGLRLDF